MKHIKNHALKEDLLYFAIPAVIILFVGLLVSFLSGPDSFPLVVSMIITNPASISRLNMTNIIGLLMMLTGFTIMIIAQISLGRSYASMLVIREDHQLVTQGIYRNIRHPIYLGVLIVTSGIAIFSASIPGLMIMLLLIPVFLIRIRFEERLLVEEFGGKYQDYQRTTRKLLPFIF